jgi:hypothetical protein
VTLTATVTAVSPESTTPVGTVTFKDGRATLGTADLNGAGVATLIFTPAEGKYDLTANFVDDSDYFKNSKSARLRLDVQALPTVQFSSDAANVSQTAGTVTLTVRRVGSMLGPVSVGFASADGTAIAGTDYSTVSAPPLPPLSWGAGDGTHRTITVPITNRGVAVPDRKFTVTLTAPSGATLGAIPTATITIHK